MINDSNSRLCGALFGLVTPSLSVSELDVGRIHTLQARIHHQIANFASHNNRAGEFYKTPLGCFTTFFRTHLEISGTEETYEASSVFYWGILED